VKAVILLRQAFKLNKEYVPALVLMGEVLRFTGQAQEAKVFFQQALKLDPQQLFARVGLAYASCDTTHMEEADKHFRDLKAMKDEQSQSFLANDAQL
jgi:tetratricopeptide (TPR) repeat protein